MLTQQRNRPAWTPRDFSVKAGVVSLVRDAVAALAAPLLEVTATSSRGPREASTANPLSSLPLSRGRPSHARCCSGWPCGQRALRAGCGSHTGRTCRKSLNQRCGNDSSNPMHAQSALLGSGKIQFRARLTLTLTGAFGSRKPGRREVGPGRFFFAAPRRVFWHPLRRRSGGGPRSGDRTPSAHPPRTHALLRPF